MEVVPKNRCVSIVVENSPETTEATNAIHFSFIPVTAIVDIIIAVNYSKPARHALSTASV